MMKITNSQLTYLTKSDVRIYNIINNLYVPVVTFVAHHGRSRNWTGNARISISPLGIRREGI